MLYRLTSTTVASVLLAWVTSGCAFDPSGVGSDTLIDAASQGDMDATSSLDLDAASMADAPVPMNPPVGQWTFNAGQELIDIRGNFPDLVLNGSAMVTGGQLDTDGSGTSATGWAVTGENPGLYSGPPIVDKTLVSWITLEQLGSDDGVSQGSAITIDRESGDHFDGIIFGEREEDRWMSGSSNFNRTDDFDPGFRETTTGIEIMLTITYDDLDDMPGGPMDITGYRNGVVMGSYSSDAGSSWSPADAEIFFGIRHGTKGGGPGALDALVNEARIYDNVLSADDIEALMSRGAE